MSADIDELKRDLEQLREENEQLRERVERLEPDDPTRRQALKALGVGVLGGGALTGGGLAATRQAAAAPSTSDTDGDLGGPNDRWDLWADGIDLGDVLEDPNGTTLIDATVPAWVAQVGQSGSPVSLYAQLAAALDAQSHALNNVGSVGVEGDITDEPNNATVYDQSTQTIGDGTQDADIKTGSIDDLLSVTERVIRVDDRGWVSYSATRDNIEQAWKDINQTSGDGNDSGTIRLPPGTTIDVGSSLDLSSSSLGFLHRGAGIVGDYGVAASTMPTAVLNSTISTGTADVLVLEMQDSIRLKGVSIDGSGSEQDGIVLDIGGVDTGEVELLGVNNTGRYGVYVTVGGDITFSNIMTSSTGDSGVRFDSGKGADNIESEDAGGWGIEIRSANFVLRDSTAEGATNSGVLLDGKGVKLVNCHTATGNGAWGYRLNQANGNGPMSLINCKTNGGNSNGAVEVNKASDVLIDGCVFNADSGTTHIKVTSNAQRVVIKRTRLEGAGTEFNLASGALDVYVADDVGSNRINGAIGASPSSGSLSLSFDTTFTHKPALNVVTESEAIWHVSSWSTDANGNYTGATLTFADNAGNAVNPTTHWKALPRNVGVV